MKKVYERPQMVVETYEANEYVAACGDKNKVYKFQCDAHKKIELIDTAAVYYSNGTKLGNFHPCGQTHEAPVTDDFESGYITSVADPLQLFKTKVIIWTNNKTNIHCTTKLDMNEWTVAKS